MDDEWSRRGATLSDKTARKKFGLTQAEIEAAIDGASFSTESGSSTGTRG